MDGAHLFLALVIGSFGCFIVGLFGASLWTGAADRGRRRKT